MHDESIRTLVSVQVGVPRTLTAPSGPWRSAIFKEPVTGPVHVGEENLEGDRQANLLAHGGPQKAVCCFSCEHFPVWRERLGAGEAFTYGAFGENFSVSGMTEAQVCIGDLYAIGSARLRVCQPRGPCINLARKWAHEALPRLLTDAGHTGFYMSVDRPGDVVAGDSIALMERPCPQVSIAAVNGALYRGEGGAERLEMLANLPELADGMREAFASRFAANRLC